jgi:hypothetical protein
VSNTSGYSYVNAYFLVILSDIEFLSVVVAVLPSDYGDGIREIMVLDSISFLFDAVVESYSTDCADVTRLAE